MNGGGTQIADFFGFGGGTGLIFGLGNVFGGTFLDGVSFPLKDVKETSALELSIDVLGLTLLFNKFGETLLVDMVLVGLLLLLPLPSKLSFKRAGRFC